jgi:hypothetical protein
MNPRLVVARVGGIACLVVAFVMAWKASRPTTIMAGGLPAEVTGGLLELRSFWVPFCLGVLLLIISSIRSFAGRSEQTQ